MVLAVVYSIGLIVAAPGRTDFSPSDENKAAATRISTEYENKLFDNDIVHAVEIQIDENSRNKLTKAYFIMFYIIVPKFAVNCPCGIFILNL